MTLVWAVLRKYWPALAILALLTVTHGYAYKHGVTVSDSGWGQRWTARDAADADVRAEAEAAARAEEQRRINAAQQVDAHAAQQIDLARTDADAARGDAERLRAQLAQLQNRLRGTGSDTAVTLNSASTTRAAMVLSELLDSCVSQRQSLAAAFDQSRVRGLACEARYDSLTPVSSKP